VVGFPTSQYGDLEKPVEVSDDLFMTETGFNAVTIKAETLEVGCFVSTTLDDWNFMVNREVFLRLAILTPFHFDFIS